MKNLANRYATLQKKMKEKAKNLQDFIINLRNMKKMHKRTIAMFKRPRRNNSPRPGNEYNNIANIRRLEGFIKNIDKKIESIKRELRKTGKRYSIAKRNTILAMAKNLSSTSKK